SDMGFVRSEEQVVEIEDETNIEEVESGNIEIDSHEPPSYNEYEEKAKESEAELQAKLDQLARQMDWNQAEQLAAMEKSVATEQKTKSKPQSLLKRMWNSLKASDMQQEENISHNQDTMPPSIHEGKSDIQDIPSFMRKDR
ncbi:MAG: hypothetical protein AAF673_03115, partial [Pseudomonadota bacterium]